MSLLGLGLCVRPEASARGTDRRAVVSSILECALMAEGLGLSAFVIDDTPTTHPLGPDPLGPDPLGPDPLGADPVRPGPLADHSIGPFSLLGHLVATTERILLGVVSPVRSMREPSILAKLVASLDVVSESRTVVVLAPGAADDNSEQTDDGWTDRDLGAAEVVRRLLTESAPTYSGPYFSLSSAWNEPRSGPIPTTTYRLVAGGTALRRAIGDAVEPIGVVAFGDDDAATLVATLHRARAASPAPRGFLLCHEGRLDASHLAPVLASVAASFREQTSLEGDGGDVD